MTNFVKRGLTTGHLTFAGLQNPTWFSEVAVYVVKDSRKTAGRERMVLQLVTEGCPGQLYSTLLSERLQSDVRQVT